MRLLLLSTREEPILKESQQTTQQLYHRWLQCGYTPSPRNASAYLSICMHMHMHILISSIPYVTPRKREFVFSSYTLVSCILLFSVGVPNVSFSFHLHLSGLSHYLRYLPPSADSWLGVLSSFFIRRCLPTGRIYIFISDHMGLWIFAFGVFFWVDRAWSHGLEETDVWDI